MKRLLRLGLLSAIVMVSIAPATLFARSAWANPASAFPSSNKNNKKKQRKKEMKRKKLILKGHRGKHNQKNTEAH